MRLVCCVLNGIEVSFVSFLEAEREWKRARTRRTWEGVGGESLDKGNISSFNLIDAWCACMKYACGLVIRGKEKV